jgi:hypothetical protein
VYKGIGRLPGLGTGSKKTKKISKFFFDSITNLISFVKDKPLIFNPQEFVKIIPNRLK